MQGVTCGLHISGHTGGTEECALVTALSAGLHSYEVSKF